MSNSKHLQSESGPTLAALIEATTIGVALVGTDLRLLEVNSAFARMHGRVPETCVGCRLSGLGATAAEFESGVRQVLATAESLDLELAQPDQTGQVRHWAGVCSPVSEGGAVVAVGLHIRDVSEHRRAERNRSDALEREQESRREAEQRRDFFRLVLENAPMVVTICEGADHRLALVNDFALRILNMPREALLDRPLAETFPEAFPLVKDAYDRVFRDGEVVTLPEALFPLPDGRKVWGYGCYAPIRHADGAPLGVMSLLLDISPLKRAQAVVESQKDVLAALAEGLPLTSVLDKIIAAISLHTDDAIPSVLLLDESGQHLRHGAASPKLPDAYLKAIDGVAIGPEVGSCGTAAFLRRRIVVEDVRLDSRWAAFRGAAAGAGVTACWSTPITGSTGRLLGTFAIYYAEPRGPSEAELTLVDLMVRTTAFAIEWCRAEEQRRGLLERERAAREEAEAANRSKDEFVATLSHELRTPLNAILGWTRMLRAGQLEAVSQTRALESIERNTRAQAQLVEDLLDLSRIITGKLRLDVRSVELSAVVAAAVDGARPAAEAKGIRLQTMLDPRAAPISGDPDRLQQVVWNLLNNAVKFTPLGGTVQVRLERINSHVEIIVADSGVGIAADLLPYVFDRFRQGDRSAAKGAGLGLGLAIARTLVELHGGSIDATSDGPQHGATFRIKLPLGAVQPARGAAEGHPTAATGLLPAALPRLPEVDLLVVEDDDDGREMVEQILVHAGARVRTAASADEAHALARVMRPAAIISDIEMPGENGYAFITRLRQEPGFSAREVPAVALTANARVEDRIKALAAGFQMHVPKPVEPAELIAVVAALVARSEPL